MDQTMFGIVAFAFILITMGGVGIAAGWPDLMRAKNRLLHKHS
ncbi:Uncharacterised protein [Pseudomonas luteola]|uniref:Uncharacterized protein n=1 Tax=Pseudomonas luteola TaxID=47886 RepID=A0A2X2C1F7_PSELU|nr:Uncharacterised protein [Pseudomonas luteola]